MQRGHEKYVQDEITARNRQLHNLQCANRDKSRLIHKEFVSSTATHMPRPSVMILQTANGLRISSTTNQAKGEKSDLRHLLFLIYIAYGIILTLTYNILQLTSVHHPILVRKADIEYVSVSTELANFRKTYQLLEITFFLFVACGYCFS
jgi:hypothetical protein